MGKTYWRSPTPPAKCFGLTKQPDRNAVTRAITIALAPQRKHPFSRYLDDAQGDYLGQESGLGIRLRQQQRQQGQRVDVKKHAFARLPNGNTRIVESKVGRVIEVDNKGKLVHSFPLKPGGTTSSRWARSTPKGTYLVCSEQPGVVTEYDVKNGKVVWDYLIKTRVYGAMRLKNGNTLIASGSGNSVVEVSPEKKVVWEIKGKVPGTDINLKWMTCLQERENGNFIVGNCHAGPDNPQIFEITREKKIVWEFNEFELVGNGLALLGK